MEKLKAFLKGFWSKGGQFILGAVVTGVIVSNTDLPETQAAQVGQSIAAGVGAVIAL